MGDWPPPVGGAPAAYEALAESVNRCEVTAIVLPSLRHLGLLGDTQRVKREFERATGARIMPAQLSSTTPRTGGTGGTSSSPLRAVRSLHSHWFRRTRSLPEASPRVPRGPLSRAGTPKTGWRDVERGRPRQPFQPARK